jgi:3-phosphoglycerate kinase
MLLVPQSSRFNNYYCTIFPTAKCFGLLLAKEIESLNKVLKNSEKPVTAVLVALRFRLKLRLLRIF